MALNAYLKIDGINASSATGGVTEATIEVQSFSWGVANSQSIGAGGSGAGAGKRTGTLHISKYTDATSVQLFVAAEHGKVLHNAVLTILPAVQNAATQPFIKWSFNEILISSLEFVGNRGGAELPLESLEFAYSGASMQVG